jgi:hypothetical protein
MNPAIKTFSWVALCCAATGLAVAQQPTAPPAAAPPPGAATAQSEAGEPRADTSNPPSGAPAAGVPSAGSPPAPGPAPAAGPAPTPRPKPSAGSAPSATAPGARTSSSAHAAAAPAKIDRLDLGTATVTGDREQPKVMYIVPWKRSDIGDLAGKPMNSLVDEILAPVDRDVFKREVVYYQAVQATASQNGASPKPAQQGEK